MEKILAKSFKASLLALSMVSVISCSSGGGGDDDDDNGIPSDFDLFEQSGTWRLTFDIASIFELEQSDGTDTINIQNNFDFMGSIVTTIKVDGNTITIADCDAETPEVTGEDDFDEEFIDELFEDLECDDEDVDYTKISDEHYRVEFSCDDINTTTLDYVKLNDSAEFDFGSLAFTFDGNADLDSSVGICGGIASGSVESIVTPQPNGIGLTNSNEVISNIVVSSPYDGNIISIEFDFEETVTVGTFSVDTFEVNVDLTSVIFGGTATDPDFVEAVTGNVNITAISEFAVTGSFDITTEDGEDIAGDFSFDIE